MGKLLFQLNTRPLMASGMASSTARGRKTKLASLCVRHPESMNPARFLGVPHSPQIGSQPQREAFRGPPEHLRSAHAAAEPRPKTGERCTAPLSWSCTQGSPSSASGDVEKHLSPHKRNF